MSESLEDYITSRFSDLKLAVPADDVEYIARLIEEEELEDEDKREGVRGMIDMHLPEDGAPDELDETIDGVIQHWRKRIEEEEEQQTLQRDLVEENDSESESDGEGDVPKSKKGKEQAALIASLSPEELAAAQRRALLAQYGYVEDDAVEQDETTGGARGTTLRKREEDKAVQERRNLIDAAIRAETKRRKKSKRSKEQVDLMAPNLNKEKVQVKQQMLREASRDQAAIARARDKAALDKQRADQAKAKADKQKKAQKQERRG